MAEIIVVHGYPGSGKSTQSTRMAKHGVDGREVVHISAGNRLRDIRTGIATSYFQDIVNHPNAPIPVDDTVINGVIFEHIPAQDVKTLALIDGYPRLESGVYTFIGSVREAKHKFLGTISLETSLETTISRVLGRGVRNGEKIKADALAERACERYEEHNISTMQAVDTLGQWAPVMRINADASTEAVWDDFAAAVGKLILQ